MATVAEDELILGPMHQIQTKMATWLSHHKKCMWQTHPFYIWDRLPVIMGYVHGFPSTHLKQLGFAKSCCNTVTVDDVYAVHTRQSHPLFGPHYFFSRVQCTCLFFF